MIKTTIAGDALAKALERQQRWADRREDAREVSGVSAVSIEPSHQKLSTSQTDAGRKLPTAEIDTLPKLQGPQACTGQKLRMAKAGSRGSREPFVNDPDAGFDWRSVFRLDDECR